MTHKTPASTSSHKHSIYGFFSLSPHMIEHHDIGHILPPKKKYKTIPSILLGRLAKDNNQKLLTGSELLLLALNEASKAREKFGGVFILTHPNDERAKFFYMKHGFQELPSNDQNLVLHTKNIPRIYQEYLPLRQTEAIIVNVVT